MANYSQNQWMEAASHLAGGVAHDFNNILAVILLQAEALEQAGSLSPEAREGLREIKKAARRGAEHTRQLMLFSRRQGIRAQDLDLNAIVANLAPVRSRIAAQKIRLEVNLQSQPLWTHADAGMLDQLLFHLTRNGCDAMPTGGCLKIETGRAGVDEAQARQEDDVAPGEYVWLSVTDTGCGIPPEALPHIFEPFFTTKDVGQGTGLGLAVVYGIVKQHRGWIDVRSALGQGTTLQVFLPAVAAPAPQPADPLKTNPGADHAPLHPTHATTPIWEFPSEPASARTLSQTAAGSDGKPRTILVVDDDPIMRTAIQLALQKHGYNVLAAECGPGALAISRHEPRNIDLLLTDIVMPEGMTGRELAAQLAVDRPGLKVIFMSGYFPGTTSHVQTLPSGQQFLQKPCTLDQLLATVQRSFAS